MKYFNYNNNYGWPHLCVPHYFVLYPSLNKTSRTFESHMLLSRAITLPRIWQAHRDNRDRYFAVVWTRSETDTHTHTEINPRAQSWVDRDEYRIPFGDPINEARSLERQRRSLLYIKQFGGTLPLHAFHSEFHSTIATPKRTQDHLSTRSGWSTFNDLLYFCLSHCTDHSVEHALLVCVTGPNTWKTHTNPAFSCSRVSSSR